MIVREITESKKQLTEWVWLVPAVATVARIAVPKVTRFFLKNKTAQQTIKNLAKSAITSPAAKQGTKKAAELLTKSLKQAGRTALKHPERVVGAYGAYEGIQLLDTLYETFTDAKDAFNYLSSFFGSILNIDEKTLKTIASIMVKYAIPAGIIIALLYGAYQIYDYFDNNKENPVKESATAGSTAAGNIATVASVPGAYRKIKKGKNGLPKAPQATNPDGTAKNAIDTNINLMGGVIKR